MESHPVGSSETRSLVSCGPLHCVLTLLTSVSLLILES